MSSFKNSKYDWPSYMPRMDQLHRAGWSVPQIHNEILDPATGFTPSYIPSIETGQQLTAYRLSILYTKFRSLGYSTKNNRAELHPVNTSMSSTLYGNSPIQILPALPTNTSNLMVVLSTGSGQKHLTSYSQVDGSNLDYIQSSIPALASAPVPLLGSSDITSNPWKTSQFPEVQDSGPAAATSFTDSSWLDLNMAELDDHHVLPDTWQAEIPISTMHMPTIETSPVLPIMTHTMSQKRLPHSNGFESPIAPSIPDSTLPVNNRQGYNGMIINGQKRARHSHGNISTVQDRSPLKRSSKGAMDLVTTRLQSWMAPRRGSYRSASPDIRFSASPRDSGYASGRTSVMLSIAEDIPPHPESRNEFKGLYRIPCRALHELHLPTHQQQQQISNYSHNVPSCTHCKFSGIHHLSWSAKLLPIDAFKQNLAGSCDIHAVDAVGNSAFHYAAVGGATYEHFLVLINAGVNPYQINTLGQLFIHYLCPDTSDDDSITLSYLLNVLEPGSANAALRWRDNEGRTILDPVASQVTHVNSSLQRPSSALENGTPAAGVNQDFSVRQERQTRAYEILGRASDEPSYVDPDTGDNILHALSRLCLSESNSVLSNVQDYVAKDVDLNVHNRDKASPLVAFIRERPPLRNKDDETGATMSKYLDALLWKDARLRIPNKINVNMKNCDGATALYYAAVLGRPDSARSLIEAGANVNARIGKTYPYPSNLKMLTLSDMDGQRISILQATRNAKNAAVFTKDELKMHLFDNVISYLEHGGAVCDPTIMQERGVCASSVRVMPM